MLNIRETSFFSCYSRLCLQSQSYFLFSQQNGHHFAHLDVSLLHLWEKNGSLFWANWRSIKLLRPAHWFWSYRLASRATTVTGNTNGVFLRTEFMHLHRVDVSTLKFKLVFLFYFSCTSLSPCTHLFGFRLRLHLSMKASASSVFFFWSAQCTFPNN